MGSAPLESSRFFPIGKARQRGKRTRIGRLLLDLQDRAGAAREARQSEREFLSNSLSDIDEIVDEGLEPHLVHSTSWRHEDRRIILTYVAAIEPPGDMAADSLVAVPVRRAELARGDATSAPAVIAVDAVIEHALRHLSWLVRDDPAVMRALDGWKQTLADFEPEPFRALA